jgi:ribosomal protein S18 acetylase RimI-like enzyme
MARDAEPPAVLRMRVDLASAPVASPWPPGVVLRTYATADAPALHALLVHGYRHGGGSVAPLADWQPALEGDAEFDPALVLLAADDDGLVGAVVCWASGFVKDLVVVERGRGRGLGAALLGEGVARLGARGARAVELKVHATNAPAIRLYERAGFRVVETLPPP